MYKNNIYFDKYLKYKSKYTELKNDLEGGKRSASKQRIIDIEQKKAKNDIKIRNNFIKNKKLTMGDIFYINKRMADMLKKIYKENLDLTLKSFCLKFMSNVFDNDITKQINELFEDSGILKSMQKDLIDSNFKLGHYLLLGMLTETRYISAIERDDRPAITKANPIYETVDFKLADDARINGIINSEYYFKTLNQISQGKYNLPKDYDKLNKIKYSKNKINLLNNIFRESIKLKKYISELFDDNILKKQIWVDFCIPLEQRRIQLLIYDMINLIVYNKALKTIYQDESLIKDVRVEFNKEYNSFVNNRNTKINKLIKIFINDINDHNTLLSLSANPALGTSKIRIILGQEVLPAYYADMTNKIEDKNDPKKLKKGENSAIISNQNIEQIEIPVNKNADLVAGTINDILFVSVHTPSDGRTTSTIIDEIYSFFINNDEFKHVIIGIDANTKKDSKMKNGESVLEDVINNVNKLGLNLSYFKDPINIELIKTGKPDNTKDNVDGMTTGAIRTLLQSQYYKALESEESYVDFIMYKSKDDIEAIKLDNNSVHCAINELNEKLNGPGDLNKILNGKNPSDHKPRSISFTLNDVEYDILSFNMAGPNKSMLEYSSI